MNPLFLFLASVPPSQDERLVSPTDEPPNLPLASPRDTRFELPWLEDLEYRTLERERPQHDPHGPLLGMEPHRAKPEKKKARKAQAKARKQNRRSK